MFISGNTCIFEETIIQINLTIMKIILSLVIYLISYSAQAQDIAQPVESFDDYTTLVNSSLVYIENTKPADEFDEFTVVIYYDDKSFKRSLKGKKVKSLRSRHSFKSENRSKKNK